MDSKSLAKVRYEQALRLLQSNEPVVQLTISQIATPVQRKVYKSEENFQSLELYSILSDGEENVQEQRVQEDGEAAVAFEDPVLRYFANMKQEQEDRAAERRQMEVSINGSLPRVLSAANKSLSFSKSAPDLPKVVAIIPKRVDRPVPPALPRSIGLGRRYTGPVRYPVTPAKDPLTKGHSLEGINKRQLSLPVNEHRESQVI